MAALLFAISVPLAKHLLGDVRPLWLAALLYLGAGGGLAVRARIGHTNESAEAPLKRSDFPLLAGAIAFGGVVAPVLLLFGLQWTPASSASLLLNFEGVFTALIAWAVFGENLGRRIAFGMAPIVAAGDILSWTGSPGLTGVAGPVAIVAACLCWALDNNLTQKISYSNPARIAMIKGLTAGSVNAAISAVTRQSAPAAAMLTAAIFPGFVSYGLSLVLYIRALRMLGTVRAGNYFSTAPFISAVLGVILWHEALTGRLRLARPSWEQQGSRRNWSSAVFASQKGFRSAGSGGNEAGSGTFGSKTPLPDLPPGLLLLPAGRCRLGNDVNSWIS